MNLGHPAYPRSKDTGDQNMPEKRGPLEDAEGVVPQDPRDRAKAALPCVVRSDVVSPTE